MEQCFICFDEVTNGFKFPNCGHQFCKECIAGTFEDKVKSKQVALSNFKCPMCEQPFDVSLLWRILSPEIYKKYCEFALECNQIYGLQPHELMVSCLNKDCNNAIIIWKDAGIDHTYQEYMSCNECRKEFCRKCFLELHPDISCEKAKELDLETKSARDEEIYRNLKQTIGIARCPNCKFMGEKIQGCNFIRCYSKQCQGKKAYCYICDIELLDADHCSHYERNDPYKAPCRVKVNGVWVDKKDAPPHIVAAAEAAMAKGPVVIKSKALPPPEEKKQVEMNKVPCPRCKNTDPSVTWLLLENSLLFCKSKGCGELRICLTCNETLEEGEVEEHYDNNFKCKMS